MPRLQWRRFAWATTVNNLRLPFSVAPAMTSISPRDVETASDDASLEMAILHTVAYADIFDYPLTVEEVHRYLGAPAPLALVGAVVANGAAGSGRLGWRVWDGYVSLPGREEIVHVRRHREQRAQALWPPALRYASLIASFPFVRMVALTGSLALDNADDGTDLDYLIVTAPDRLWLCRSFLLIIVRWARRRGDVVCPNYLVSERALALEQRNLFVARELAQMVPLFGLDVYDRMRAANGWSRAYLPNADGPPGVPTWRIGRARDLPALARPLQGTLEWGMGSPVGRWLDRWEMRRKTARWRRQYPHQPEAAFGPDWCKGHFDAHGQRILAALAERVQAIDEVPG